MFLINFSTTQNDIASFRKLISRRWITINGVIPFWAFNCTFLSNPIDWRPGQALWDHNSRASPLNGQDPTRPDPEFLTTLVFFPGYPNKALEIIHCSLTGDHSQFLCLWRKKIFHYKKEKALFFSFIFLLHFASIPGKWEFFVYAQKFL